MTHTRHMEDSEGDFSDWRLTELTCRECSGHQVAERLWEGSDGGYDDYQYRCNDCGHMWWIEGPDA